MRATTASTLPLVLWYIHLWGASRKRSQDRKKIKTSYLSVNFMHCTNEKIAGEKQERKKRQTIDGRRFLSTNYEKLADKGF